MHVTCIISDDCVLPCSFPPGSNETIQWFKQDVAVYSYQWDGGEDDTDSGQAAGRASLVSHLVSRGNATLVLRDSGPKDRGRYRCRVRTSAGVHDANIIVKVEGESTLSHLMLSKQLFSLYVTYVL